MEKIKLFLDFDSTIVNTSEVGLDILNERYGTNYKLKDLKKYDYSDLFPDVGIMVVSKILYSDEFFDRLKFIDGVLDFIEPNRKKFDFYIVTRSNYTVDRKKMQWINLNFPENISPKLISVLPWQTKRCVDMHGGIFIDDVYDNLEKSNASVRILFAPNPESEWSKYKNLDNFYVTSSWKDINKILDFMVKHKEFI